MMYERLTLMRELLSEDGSLFLHCDWHVNFLLRSMLDEIFGRAMFRNEIVWYYYNKYQGNIKRFASNHDTILWYTKSSKYQFTRQKEERAAPTRQLKRVWDKDKQALVNAKDPETGKVMYQRGQPIVLLMMYGAFPCSSPLIRQNTLDTSPRSRRP